MSTLHESLLTIGKSARHAAHDLLIASSETKNQALTSIAAAILENQLQILYANEKDMYLAEQKQLAPSFMDRLHLHPQRIKSMAESLESIALQPDPVGRILMKTKRPNGLEISRTSVPIGVIGIIYESRPNVTADAAGLCLKAGNAVILRGGSESFYSTAAIMSAIHEGLKQVKLPLSAVQMITTKDRDAVNEMLKMDKYIDVIIPRGGTQLIEHIVRESRIPLLKHSAGLCHTYIHQGASLGMARKIVLNAKMRRTGICGATEVLLIDQSIIATHLKTILDDLISAGCEIRGNHEVKKFDSRVQHAGEKDYDTEFLAAIISVKIVADLSAAIDHIKQHGSQHTDAIITEDNEAAETFFKNVDSAIVMHNASTQFADGGEFGMGAEIGIATGKLHARGPVGAEQLTTFKYLVRGVGQIRA